MMLPQTLIKMMMVFEDPTVTEMSNESPSNQHASKRSRLESVTGKITSNVDYSIWFNQCVINNCLIFEKQQNCRCRIHEELFQ